MKRTLTLLVSSLVLLTTHSLKAQVPDVNGLKETDELQRRDLSTIGSRIVINPFNFHTPAKEVTAAAYSNRPSMPLNIAYYTMKNVYHDSEKRFGREFKDVLELRLKTNSGSLEEASTFTTEWMPHGLPFSAQYKNGAGFKGYDFFYDDNTVVRVLNFDKKETYQLSGLVRGSVSFDEKNQVVVVHSGNCKYAIATKGMSKNKISYYATAEDLKGGKNALKSSDKALYWSFEIKGQQRSVISAAYALNTDSDQELVKNVLAPLKKNDVEKVYAANARYWSDFLKNKIPHPVNFEITSIDSKGVTADQIRLSYYKAWVFLAQNVLIPEGEEYPYYQLVTGMASLWDEGHESAPFSAAWESFVALQMFAYIDADIAWSSLKGLLSLVDDEGMLGGESLPSRKAHSAWVLYELSKDKKSLQEVYPAIERYLNWRLTQPRWIYQGLTPENEKDAEFVVSAIVDMEYMSQIASELDMPSASAEWLKKRTDYIEQYKKWFWATPQDMPIQHINHFKGRDTHPIQITQGLYLKEIKGDYYESLLGLFYKYYDTNQSFAGFNAPKYPDVDFTIYGLIQNNKNILARGLIEANLRDIILAQNVFAETYTHEDIPFPGGVRPSIFGMAAMIDFTLLKNGYMYTKGTPTVVNLYPEQNTGVKNIPYLKKHIDISHTGGNEVKVSGSALTNPKKIKVELNGTVTLF